MVLSKPLLAHAFGQVYNLPVPLWLYLYGGAAAVILSFIVVGFFVDKKPSDVKQTEPKKRFTFPANLVMAIQLLSIAITTFVVGVGLIGQQTSLDNFSVTFFWVIFLVGFTYVVAIFGDLWLYLNPVKAILALSKSSHPRTTPRLAYPDKLGFYPALVTYIGLIWLELLSSGFGIVPANLAKLIVAYIVVNLIGGFLYGQEAWLRHGDFLSVLFGLVSKLSPFQRQDDAVYLRAPLISLLDDTPKSVSLLLFVLFMLASTAYDGFHETTAFSSLYHFMVSIPIISLLPHQVIPTVMLLLAPLAFLAVYLLFMYLMKIISRTELTTKALALKFSLTLVPIAVAYNAAHYYTLLVIQGQLIIKLLSDPLGIGWNLFHTAGYKINVGILNAATVWYSQVALIVLGHIAAVYLAHRVALKIFPSLKKAVLSQYPMLILMVVYTMTSLWIIAQPITHG